jgi:protein-disulfide isomerase
LLVGLVAGLGLGWLLPSPFAEPSASAAPAPSATAPAPSVAPSPSGSPATSTPTALSPATPTPVPGGPDGTEELGGFLIGTEGALVELFEDYVCPFCARLETASGEQLRQGALDGEYRLLLHPMAFLTEDSPRAANASACVYQHTDEDTWFAFHSALYARQDPSEQVGQFANAVLLGIAAEVGADSPAVQRCVEDGTYLEWVAALTQQAFQRGVRGTPTVTLDGGFVDTTPLLQPSAS